MTIVVIATVGMTTAMSLAASPKTITCVGIFTDYPTHNGKSIVGDKGDTISSIKNENADKTDSGTTCYLPWGHASHSPFKGLCSDGERCGVVGTLRKKVGTIYFVDWLSASVPND